jgi:hypothetical protein
MSESITEEERIALEEAGKRSVEKIREQAQLIIGNPNRSGDDQRWLGRLTQVLDFFDRRSQTETVMDDYGVVRVIEEQKAKWLAEDQQAGTESPEDLKRREMELKGFRLLTTQRLNEYSEGLKVKLS